MYPCKPKILPLLAELFGLFPLVAYNCWQTVKTDALSSFRGVGTANYSTNNHLPISQQFTQHEYLHNNYGIYTWYTNMADDITCTSYDVSCLFHFLQVCQNIGTLFVSNLMLEVIENYIPQCMPTMQSSNEMVIDWATLAAMYRLCFSIF